MIPELIRYTRILEIVGDTIRVKASDSIKTITIARLTRPGTRITGKKLKNRRRSILWFISRCRVPSREPTQEVLTWTFMM
jgi:hypothetical protein